MRRQLIGRVVATTALVLIALLLPLGHLIGRFAEENALAVAGLEVQATESVVASQDRADQLAFVEELNNNNDETQTTVLYADGDAIGPDKDVTAAVLQARETRRAVTHRTSEVVEILVPVSLASSPDTEVNAEDPDPPVIRVKIDQNALFPEVVLAWLILAGLGVGLLAVAVVVAELLVRDLVRSSVDLAAAAGRFAAGDLGVRAAPSGPPEIRDVGHALNRLAGRIEELLAAEREDAADLSHRMRTPLMALRLEAEQVRDLRQQARILNGVLVLSRTVDEVIAEVRRPLREGIGASCDAAEVVRERTAFWAVLAEDQGRPIDRRLVPGPLHVKASAGDLGAAVDVLLENVFAHTEDGVAFTVELTGTRDGGALLRVVNQGSGSQAPITKTRGDSASGSTGLGLDIAARTARASGGGLTTTSTPTGMTTVEMSLGPSAHEADPQRDERQGFNRDQTPG